MENNYGAKWGNIFLLIVLITLVKLNDVSGGFIRDSEIVEDSSGSDSDDLYTTTEYYTYGPEEHENDHENTENSNFESTEMTETPQPTPSQVQVEQTKSPAKPSNFLNLPNENENENEILQSRKNPGILDAMVSGSARREFVLDQEQIEAKNVANNFPEYVSAPSNQVNKPNIEILKAPSIQMVNQLAEKMTSNLNLNLNPNPMVETQQSVQQNNIYIPPNQQQQQNIGGYSNPNQQQNLNQLGPNQNQNQQNSAGVYSGPNQNQQQNVGGYSSPNVQQQNSLNQQQQQQYHGPQPASDLRNKPEIPFEFQAAELRHEYHTTHVERPQNYQQQQNQQQYGVNNNNNNNFFQQQPNSFNQFQSQMMSSQQLFHDSRVPAPPRPQYGSPGTAPGPPGKDIIYGTPPLNVSPPHANSYGVPNQPLQPRPQDYQAPQPQAGLSASIGQNPSPYRAQNQNQNQGGYSNPPPPRYPAPVPPVSGGYSGPINGGYTPSEPNTGSYSPTGPSTGGYPSSPNIAPPVSQSGYQQPSNSQNSGGYPSYENTNDQSGFTDGDIQAIHAEPQGFDPDFEGLDNNVVDTEIFRRVQEIIEEHEKQEQEFMRNFNREAAEYEAMFKREYENDITGGYSSPSFSSDSPTSQNFEQTGQNNQNSYDSSYGNPSVQSQQQQQQPQQQYGVQQQQQQQLGGFQNNQNDFSQKNNEYEAPSAAGGYNYPKKSDSNELSQYMPFSSPESPQEPSEIPSTSGPSGPSGYNYGPPNENQINDEFPSSAPSGPSETSQDEENHDDENVENDVENEESSKSPEVPQPSGGYPSPSPSPNSPTSGPQSFTADILPSAGPSYIPPQISRNDQVQQFNPVMIPLGSEVQKNQNNYQQQNQQPSQGGYQNYQNQNQQQNGGYQNSNNYQHQQQDTPPINNFNAQNNYQNLAGQDGGYGDDTQNGGTTTRTIIVHELPGQGPQSAVISPGDFQQINAINIDSSVPSGGYGNSQNIQQQQQQDGFENFMRQLNFENPDRSYLPPSKSFYDEPDAIENNPSTNVGEFTSQSRVYYNTIPYTTQSGGGSQNFSPLLQITGSDGQIYYSPYSSYFSATR